MELMAPSWARNTGRSSVTGRDSVAWSRSSLGRRRFQLFDQAIGAVDTRGGRVDDVAAQALLQRGGAGHVVGVHVGLEGRDQLQAQLGDMFSSNTEAFLKSSSAGFSNSLMRLTASEANRGFRIPTFIKNTIGKEEIT